MRISKVQEGERIAFPLKQSDKWIGWGITDAPCNGLLIALDPKDGTGIFLTDSQLEEFGYHFSKKCKELLDNEE